MTVKWGKWQAWAYYKNASKFPSIDTPNLCQAENRPKFKRDFEILWRQVRITLNLFKFVAPAKEHEFLCDESI